MKRVFDFVVSTVVVILLIPVFIVIGVLILIDSKGSLFYKQQRVGKNNKDFNLLKFRTMYINSDKFGLLTVGERDKRITNVGFYLRKYKLDELPQFINVFLGDMSIIGPRPEVRKYVNLYTPEQMEILNVKPGISDYASIEYSNENEILSRVDDPEKYYIEIVLPHKIELNKKYLLNPTLFHDLKLIFKTIGVILFKR